MQVKTRLACAAAILVPAPPGQRNEDEPMGIAAFMDDAAGRLIAIDARHADVDKDDVWLELIHDCDAGGAVVGSSGNRPEGLQQKYKAVCDVMIVIYYKRPRRTLTHSRPRLSLSCAYPMSYRFLKISKTPFITYAKSEILSANKCT